MISLHIELSFNIQWGALGNDDMYINGYLPRGVGNQGWGSLKLRSLISPLGKFSILQRLRLESLNHIHIWQMSPQLGCGGISQMLTCHSIGNPSRFTHNADCCYIAAGALICWLNTTIHGQSLTSQQCLNYRWYVQVTFIEVSHDVCIVKRFY